MLTEQITISVDAEAARVYRSASDEERRKLEALISWRLLETTRPQKSLKEIMVEASQMAKERGLTEETLQSLLEDE